MPKVKITLIKSGIGYAEDQKATIRSLGLRKLHQSVIFEDSSSLRGMVKKIGHLIKIEEASQ